MSSNADVEATPVSLPRISLTADKATAAPASKPAAYQGQRDFFPRV
ncbi:MAG: hypothetical protein HY814_00630 [Candidatus Riflebacteria bacterium]|nr:hypothetical protein [Candidatus Riflebacteria bacterium]